MNREDVEFWMEEETFSSERNLFCFLPNSPVLQFGGPPAIDSGEAKISTASWKNVYKHMLRNIKLHLSMFQMT